MVLSAIELCCRVIGFGMFLHQLGLFRSLWGDDLHAVSTFIMFKTLWTALFMPLFFIAITDRPSESRLYGLLGGISSWIESLVVRHVRMGLHNGQRFSADPFYDPEERNESDAQVFDMSVMDAAMFGFLGASIITLIWNSSGSFDGYASSLHVPIAHRQRLLIGAVVYWLVTGCCEMWFILSSHSLNSELELTSWVWPPDYTDCSKPLSLAYSLCKLLLGAYAMAVLVCNGHCSCFQFHIFKCCNSAQRPAEDREYKLKRLHSSCQLIAAGTVLCWCAEIVFASLEQSYGLKYHTMVAFAVPDRASTALGLYDLGKDPCQIRTWHKRGGMVHGENATMLFAECKRWFQSSVATTEIWIDEENPNNRAFWHPQSVVRLDLLPCAQAEDVGTCVFNKIVQTSYVDLPNRICVNSSWHVAECTSEYTHVWSMLYKYAVHITDHMIWLAGGVLSWAIWQYLESQCR